MMTDAAVSNAAGEVLGLLQHANASYARVIDNDLLEQWPDHFVADCKYVIQTAQDHMEGLDGGIVFANSHGMLRDRISALREANIYEGQTYRHIVGLPFILARDGDGIRSETPFLVARIMRDGTTDLYASGRYVDLHRIEDGVAKLAERIVICDSSRIDTLLALPL